MYKCDGQSCLHTFLHGSNTLYDISYIHLHRTVYRHVGPYKSHGATRTHDILNIFIFVLINCIFQYHRVNYFFLPVKYRFIITCAYVYLKLDILFYCSYSLDSLPGN